MNLTSVSALFLALILIARYYVQRKQLRQAKRVMMTALVLIVAAMPPQPAPSVQPPQPPDERKKTPTPVQGVAVAPSPPDAGSVDGSPSSMLARETDGELAGVPIAVDYEAAPAEFHVGGSVKTMGR